MLLTCSRRCPVSACSGEPGDTLTVCAASCGGWSGRCSSWVRSGTCWCRVPPAATLSACMPRQMARIGRSRRRAARSMRHSYSSAVPATLGPSRGGGGRRVGGGPEPRGGGAPVGRGVEVGAAAEEHTVDPVQQGLEVVGEAVRGEDHRDPARLADRLYVREPEIEPRGAQVTLAAPRRRGPGGRGILTQLVRDDADQWWASVQDGGSTRWAGLRYKTRDRRHRFRVSTSSWPAVCIGF